MMFHDRKKIVKEGFKSLGKMKFKGQFHEIRELAIKHDLDMESVTAFRINLKDEWEAFARPDAKQGYVDRPILPEWK